MSSIAETYRLTKKSPDLVWNEYVCRPIAAVLVHALRDSRVTPNQVTLVALVVAGVSATLLLVLPGHVGLLVAVLVFELSYVLDCADGMLARLRGLQSVQGHLFDFLMDELKAFAILGAASVRLFLERGRDPLPLLVGIAGLIALASGIALTTFVRRPEIAPPQASQPSSSSPRSAARGMVGIAERIAKLLIHYPSYIWLVAVVGQIDLYLYPYVVVNTLYAARMLASVALRFGRR